MTVPTPAMLYTQGFGSRPENVEIPTYQTRAPASTDNRYPQGKVWINESANDVYQLTSFSVSNGVQSAVWTLLNNSGSSVLSTLTGNSGGAISPTAGNINLVGSGALAIAGSGSTLTGSITPGTALVATMAGNSGGALSPTAGAMSVVGSGAVNVAGAGSTLTISVTAGTSLLSTLTADSGGALSPTLGNINIAGTASQITTSGAGSTVTLSLPSAVVTPGSLESATTLVAGTGFSVSSGDAEVLGGDMLVTRSDAAADVTIEATNSDNTSGASRAGVEIAVGGSSSGDPYLSFQISGVGASTMTMGLDNSASDLFVISNSTAVGTSNALTLSQAGALAATTSITATLGDITATNGNLVLVAEGNKMMRTSVATTTTAGANSIGSVTLAGGTATVNTSSVTASSLIQIWRQSVGSTGSAALGQLSVGAISAGSSFEINAWSAADATVLQASDVSVIGWEIIN